MLRSVAVTTVNTVNTVKLTHQSVEFNNTLTVWIGGMKAVQVGIRLGSKCLRHKVQGAVSGGINLNLTGALQPIEPKEGFRNGTPHGQQPVVTKNHGARCVGFP